MKNRFNQRYVYYSNLYEQEQASRPALDDGTDLASNSTKPTTTQPNQPKVSQRFKYLTSLAVQSLKVKVSDINNDALNQISNSKEVNSTAEAIEIIEFAKKFVEKYSGITSSKTIDNSFDKQEAEDVNFDDSDLIDCANVIKNSLTYGKNSEDESKKEVENMVDNILKSSGNKVTDQNALSIFNILKNYTDPVNDSN